MQMLSTGMAVLYFGKLAYDSIYATYLTSRIYGTGQIINKIYEILVKPYEEAGSNVINDFRKHAHLISNLTSENRSQMLFVRS